ncbi:hypothetical protein ACJW30_01G031700 [Castanea mollissima]
MLRLCFRTRRSLRFPLSNHPRLQFSSSQNPIEPSNDLEISLKAPPPPPSSVHHPLTTTTAASATASLSRNSLLALSATLLSSLIASYYAILSTSDEHNSSSSSSSSTTTNPLYSGIERAVKKSSDSVNRIFHHAKQTGVAASVLWQSLSSVLSSANHEVRSGFELRVAALLADISAANASRRAAIVGAGGGAVVDWLLESVAVPRDGFGTQAESARALAYLIADPNVSASVLGRPHAIPKLLRFIFSCHPQRSKKQSRRSSFDVSDSLKGRSMLVAAIMDIVTSSCDISDKVSFQPSLPGHAETGDIAAAIQVLEEGGIHLDESNTNQDDEDGGNGIKGIGMKIFGGTTVLGLSRASELMELGIGETNHVQSARHTPKALFRQNKYDGSLMQANNLSSVVVPGLWDDLHCEHVSVPFAAWALASWAMASEVNRSHIQELDQDGHAVMTALVAPERSVKWHGSLVARLLLEDRNLPLNDSVSDWSSSLLSTISQASKNEDISLALVALSAFQVSVERSPEAKKIVMEKGLHLMRDTAKRLTKHKHVQDALAKALELICTGDMHLSLKESQKWSGILLPWIYGKNSSDTVRSSAKKILYHILEDYGPSSVPISQGWLAILLTEILDSAKTLAKGSTQPKNDKVKTKIDQSNILSATQIANQLAVAVVNLAVKQLGTATGSVDTFPLADLLILEPFVGPLKNLKKDNLAKFDAADSALATLKGIKALTEICAEEPQFQEKITDFGVLCLLRRFLLCDDFEKLAAIEAYDASRTLEAQDRVPNGHGESPVSDTNDSSSVRVPATAHIRKHAARLLAILSLLPKAQKVIMADKTWCKWLEDCANGKIPGCSDPKIQSYARATLLNIFCNHQIDKDHVNKNLPDTGVSNRDNNCPQYKDMVFLINPELSHWKCPEQVDRDNVRRDKSSTLATTVASEGTPVNTPPNDGSFSSSVDYAGSQSELPLLDVVFVHGIRGGAYRSWRIAEDKTSTTSGLVEKIDEEAGKLGTFWPGEWLSSDFPQARMFTLKYKTNLTQWSGASLPLQEVSSMLLEKLVAAGIGNRPVVFVTHSMGGLVVKQMLYKAKAENIDNLVNNTAGVVFYSCPHFGSKLADMPWRMGLVFRPAPTIGELRSGSPRLVELNDYIRDLHKKGVLDVLSFCETKVTPLVEGYGGWAFRMEIVSIESAYPGFGELVVSTRVNRSY